MGQCMSCGEQTADTARLEDGRKVPLCRACRRRFVATVVAKFIEEATQELPDEDKCRGHEIVRMTPSGYAVCDQGRIHVRINPQAVGA